MDTIVKDKAGKDAVKKKDIWLPEPEAHDFPAAQDYLELLFEPKEAKAFVTKLEKTATIVKKSKDIFRASELPILPKENFHVQENFKKMKKGIRLSPILLVRAQNKVIIADGYHRLCAAYYVSEDLSILCRLV